MCRKIFCYVTIICMVPAYVIATVAEGWEKHVIGDQAVSIFLDVGDIDADGDLDVVASSHIYPYADPSPAEVAWFKNNISEEKDWEKVIISSEESDFIQAANGLKLADMDEDGHIDVIVGTGTVLRKKGFLYWFKAPEDPHDVWQRFLIDDAPENAYFSIDTMDVNADGALDILAGGLTGAYWFLNPGSPDAENTEWGKIPLPEGTGMCLRMEDMNNDGKIDIVNSSVGDNENEWAGGNVSWIDFTYQNETIEYQRTMIDSNLPRAYDMGCIDVNDDGYKDVIIGVYSMPSLLWYEAPATSAGSWSKHQISDFIAEEADIADIDSDGELEFFVSGMYLNKVSYFKHTVSGGEVQWNEYVIDDEIMLPSDILVRDLDADGDLDIAVCSWGENQVQWYENKLDTVDDSDCILEMIFAESPSVVTKFRFIRDNAILAVPGGNGIVNAYYTVSASIVKILRYINIF